MEHRTADGVPIVDGMRVWDNNVERVIVRLAGSWEEYGRLWFDTSNAATGLQSHVMSNDRVATRHPRTGEEA
jgi:hypothetical protein